MQTKNRTIKKGRVKYYGPFPEMNNKMENRYDRAYKNEGNSSREKNTDA